MIYMENVKSMLQVSKFWHTSKPVMCESRHLESESRDLESESSKIRIHPFFPESESKSNMFLNSIPIPIPSCIVYHLSLQFNSDYKSTILEI